LIGGKPAATKEDACTCVGEPDKIEGGSSGVYIGGKPAARMGDRCAHGGKITSGCNTVLIGERRGERAINQAIQDCIALLERKLALLEQNESETLEGFEKWFGKHGDKAKQKILERIRRALEVGRRLTVKNFNYLNNAQKSEKTYGLIYGRDKSHTIYLGDKFWKTELAGDSKSKGGVIIHELSHFKDIGKTDDITYGIRGCIDLAKHHPKEAIKNADSFQYFIEK
jgi:hypothetical protein